MISRLRSSALIGAGLVLALSACAGGAGGGTADSLESMEPVTLTYTSADSAQSSEGKAFQAFAAEVKEKSGGKITIEGFFSGSLMPSQEALQGVGSGVADMGGMSVAYFPQELPVNNWLMAMGSLPSNSFPHGLLSGSAAVMQLQSTTTQEALQQEWASHNLKPIMRFQNGIGYGLLCTKPVTSLADAQGLRVRTAGGAWSGELEALGMVPVSLPFLETYEGMQRGVVDCMTGTPVSIIQGSLWEVAPHYIPVSLNAYNADNRVINLDTWNSLPAEAQAVITEAAHTWWTAKVQGVMAEYASFAAEGPSEHGVVFHNPEPLDAALDRYHADVIANATSTGPPAVTDPQGFIDDYRALLDEWMNKTEDVLGAPAPPRDPNSIRESYASAQQLGYTRFDDLTAQELFSAGPR